MSMKSRAFTGLSAFPLTPLKDDALDETAFASLISHLVEAGVDSIGALGSTGSYAYLSRVERARATTLAVQHADGIPVIVGIGALRLRDVLDAAEDAQNAGAAGLLLAPMTYQPLTDDEVLGLYEDVAEDLSVPLVVYDNPGTTHAHFSDELHARIAQIPAVASIKIPPFDDLDSAVVRVAQLRARIPERIGLGISGDASGVAGVLAGCDTWYSSLAGVLPKEFCTMFQAASSGDSSRAQGLSERFSKIWKLCARYGSYRVSAAIAEALGLVGTDILPRPVRSLDATGRAAVEAAVARLVLA